MSEGLPHHAENPQQKQIGIFISVLAVIMAIVSAVTNQQANQMIVKEVKASNGFAWYQSKRQRSYANELEIKRIEFELAGTPTEAQRKIIEAQKEKFTAKNAEYEGENKKILADAEADRAAAATASHKHHWFELSEICLHIAVVLCSLVLLTELGIFLKLGIIVTVAGLAIAAYAHFGNHSHHGSEAGHAPAAVKPAETSGH
ncbi:MAG: DUF4337 family protein [Verrucomicrobiota bacterium]|nr:DUF4337 family protein [Verrucomicrobiota bacterium]